MYIVLCTGVNAYNNKMWLKVIFLIFKLYDYKFNDKVLFNISSNFYYCKEEEIIMENKVFFVTGIDTNIGKACYWLSCKFMDVRRI